ncbi:hypothetical protein BEWA_049400 [Theileria equi strain WA]|uniref:Uncharacterized protein n=1 Tax=Theileria equi strain WA TaxID=1537102 RepID=L1LBD1_THEEQ|nr:hypothetical protein BEWA_049400 [Theileria equi strain WA]EKX72473.1 hypothetical protein BEWA_049400 [Theileria equi strain WA]|eukprot:XP_004831925.1 hypothetical protein BEWA_049400 [Theileria equi strain WA]
MARNCQYSEYWDKSHYNVDIDEDVSRSGTYIDRCVNTINIEKVDNKPTGGYKQYRHSFNNHKVQIANIRHKNQNQDGFDEIKNKTYIEVSVFYFEFDIGNDLPLLVKLTKSNTTHEYYKKVDYFVTSSSWKTDLDVKEESQLSPKLTEISRGLNTVIVLRVNQVKNGTYYANGTEKPPDANQTTQVQVIHSTYETVYKKYLHKLPYKKLRVIYTKTSNKNIPFESPVLRNEYNEASVYFWEGDDSRANPLLLELKPASNTPSYYILSGEGIGKKWTKDSNTPSTLKEKLDKQNCERNQAHTIDISKKSSSSSNNYDCPSCVSTPAMISITSSSIDQANVIKYSHKVIIGSIGKFVCKGKTQRGIDITANIKTATVYWYPEIGTLIPLEDKYK